MHAWDARDLHEMVFQRITQRKIRIRTFLEMRDKVVDGEEWTASSVYHSSLLMVRDEPFYSQIARITYTNHASRIQITHSVYIRM